MNVPKFDKASDAAKWIAKSLNKDNWTQGALTRDSRDIPLDNWRSDDAAKFCALGWMKVANQGHEVALREKLIEAVPTARYGIADWNDSRERTYLSVKCAFSKTAKLLAAKGL